MVSCPACGTENPAGARFCMGCGARLERRCPTCDTRAPAEAHFCMSCGAALDETPVVKGPERPPEERRQVTVLFADLSGYTAFAERMDPEAVKSLVDRALMRLGREVERYGGTVDKYIGDNVMALFGAPVAHEDDAERAVRAGLGMQDAMEEVNAGLPAEINFDLRVGVNTGEVIAGAVGETYTVVGDTVNVASRLQSAARPGSVTVGERTMRASESAVDYERLEPLMLKGKAQPVPAWEAVCLIAEQAVGRVAPARESPLVGRDQELTALETLYGRVLEENTPQLATLIGEAGVGKSRLLREFERRLAQHPSQPALRTGRCLPYGSGIVFWALGEVLRAEASIVDSDSAEEAWTKLSLLRERAARRRGRGRGSSGGDDRAAARRRGPARARAPRGEPGARTRALLLRAPLRHRGDRAAAPARDRIRGHPLGGRRHARGDRAPRAVGPRAAPARVPRPRRAARPQAGLGRRKALGDTARARAAQRRPGP